MTAKTRNMITVAVAVMAVLLLIAGGMWEAFNLFGQGGATPVFSSGGPDSEEKPSGPPIKVGVFLSLRTGTEPSWAGGPYGFDVQVRVLGELRDPNFVISPIVEPGTEKRNAMVGPLNKYFPGAAPIDGADPAALEKLDVIVASATWRTTKPVIDGVEEAVKHGVGLINGAGMGVEGPEYAPNHPSVAEVAGLVEGQYGWNSDVVPCKVLNGHPILGNLAKGEIVHLAPNGAYGIIPPDAIPLIGLTSPDQAWGAGNNLSHSPKYVFYPLYVSSLGKGKIIGCQFAPYMGMPQELQSATRHRFYIRCVKWLAGRPLQ